MTAPKPRHERGTLTIAARVGLIASLVLLTMTCTSGAARAGGFGVTKFDGGALNQDGTPFTQAGGHPYQASAEVDLESAQDKNGFTIPADNAKDIDVTLPPGLVGDPEALPQCAEPELGEFEIGLECPGTTQVGLVRLHIGGLLSGESPTAVFNMVPPAGAPAAFAFNSGGVLVQLVAKVLPAEGYRVEIDTRNISQGLPVLGFNLAFWGLPSDPSHDEVRGLCLENHGSCPSQGPSIPFLRNPTDCAAGPLTTSLLIDSWQAIGAFQPASFVSHDNAVPPNPIGVDGCNRVPFSPSIKAEPTTTSAESPTGLNVTIMLPQTGSKNLDAVSEADLKDAVVTLPEGMSVDPSSANGLEACSASQVDLTGEGPATCPDASKIGAVEIDTPLIGHPLKGGVYLARQGENKFGSLLAIYLAVDDPQTGVVVKLPGKIETTASGRVTARFEENPQLPFEELHVELFNGPRAPLITPPTCGSYSTTAQFTPWSGTPPVTSTSSFQITGGPNGSACPNGSFAPKLEAGTTNPVAGKYSPFVLNLSREDGTQQLSTTTAALPKGLLGKLAGIPYCPDSALGGIPSAEGTGAAQLANPSCPSASQLGTVSVGAGAGPSPFFVNTGKVYLAGPYKGAPLSLAIVTPALAGPFDLGNVVVRAALQVNPETTQITAVSDPLPTILHGIPLDLRSVAVNISRDGFTLNPTSCNPMEVSSTIGGTQGAIAHPSSRFQVASCESLGFAPKLALSLKGGTTRAKDPALKAVLTSPEGQANIGKVQVILPKSVFIDQSHVGNPCTRVQFNEGAGNGSACPAKSILGKATAYSPLLEKPLTGPVYFRSNGGERKLPDLVASLDGQIHVNLVGFIDSVHQKGTQTSSVRNTFASVPDAPVSRFVLELQGGKKGLLQNSTNLCKSTNKATVKMDGQNGKVNDFETVVKPACGSKSKSKKPKKK
jgi:hypothetical protein